MSVAEFRNDTANARRQLIEDAHMYSDVRDALRDCEEAVALLLKDCGDDEAVSILAQLEEAKGIAGRKKMECE